MYNNIKSCVKYNNQQSEYFPCLTGVRQGENLSPFLFSIFLNDLEKFFIDLGGCPLEIVKEKCQNELNSIMKLFAILYADDTVILADSAESMQNALNIFQNYCELWKLEVNVTKTKSMVFSKGKVRRKFEFKLQGKNIELVDTYSYLGLIFKCNGTFNEAKKKLVNQAQKALYSLYKSIRNQAIPLDLQLKMFDAMVEPILLYGCEIWGYENLKILEQIHLNFCKRILRVRSSTPNYMVYGELGRFPLEIKVKIRMTSFWRRIMHGDKLSSNMYRLLLSLMQNSGQSFKWLNFIESIFNDTGLGYVFVNQDSADYKHLIKQVLQDQYIQKWHQDVQLSSRGVFYSSYKNCFGFENYLIKIPENARIWMTKLRTSNIKIPIETGRWHNIPAEDRKCHICKESVGDEFHYLFICKSPQLVTFREQHIPSYYTKHPSKQKLSVMLSYCNVNLYRQVASFIKKLNNLL